MLDKIHANYAIIFGSGCLKFWGQSAKSRIK